MNDFTWCDLSTFDLGRALIFYQQALGWEMISGDGSDDDYVQFAHQGEPIAGVYTMPTFFQNIKMPSFWMSYIRVDDLQLKVEAAESLGGKIEIQPTEFDEFSRFALVRDPSGAGFSLYEGPPLRDPVKQECCARHELHVPELDVVQEFYRKLFNWSFSSQTQPGYHAITNEDRAVVGALQEFDDSIKGPKNYWAIVFPCSNLEKTLARIKQFGGRVTEVIDSPNRFAMCFDDQNAMFCMQSFPG